MGRVRGTGAGEAKPGLPALRAFLAGVALSCALPGVALAQQNLIANAGFENNPPPSCGNNFPHPIPPWIVGAGNDPNVVKVDGNVSCTGYTAGPRLDANPAAGAGTIQHYLDIANGANDFYQAFVVPSCGAAPGQSREVRFGGWFSTRDNRSGTGSISIRRGAGATGAIVEQLNVALPSGDSMLDGWVQVQGTATVTSGDTISYVVAMDNDVNFDEAHMSFVGVDCVSAPLTLQKTWVDARVGDSATLTATRDGNVIDTLVSTADTANETDTDATPVTVFEGETITLAETLSAADYDQALSCAGGGTLAGSTLTVDDSGTPIVCTYTNTGPTIEADLEIVKTASPASVPSGASTPVTYTLVVTNRGPATVTGAVVTDVAAAGLTCPAAAQADVACSGSAAASACPGTVQTVAQLQGAGVTLGALPASAGQNAVILTYQCTAD